MKNFLLSSPQSFSKRYGIKMTLKLILYIYLLLQQAKSNGINLTVETFFHYLCFSSEKIPNGKPNLNATLPFVKKAIVKNFGRYYVISIFFKVKEQKKIINKKRNY